MPDWLQYYLDLRGRAQGQGGLPFSPQLPPAVSNSILTRPAYEEGRGFPGGVSVPSPDQTGEEGDLTRLSQEMMYLEMLRNGGYAMPESFAPPAFTNQFGPKHPQSPAGAGSWPFAMY